ncbi:hypothetical protein [Halioxenophilus aromaticivorans]|uniref:hypothetical protein n=1 Tax=Halioxenophilus aromaticivorans TaxID=1306992 RepID=UPI0031EB5C91
MVMAMAMAMVIEARRSEGKMDCVGIELDQSWPSLKDGQRGYSEFISKKQK